MPTTSTREQIDERILRIIGLEDYEVEMDYSTYKSAIKEFLSAVDRGKKVDSGEVELVSTEFKRIKRKQGRFRVEPKKTKISAESLGIGGIKKQTGAVQGRLMLPPGGGALAKTNVDAISKEDVGENPLITISKTLDSILATLVKIADQSKDSAEAERKKAEQDKRKKRELGLESKVFEGLKKAVSTVTKPFQSIFDKIIKFIMFTLIGRAVVKLFDWFSDKKNKDKIQSIFRFLKDKWPLLLALYLRFGTGFGRFIGTLTNLLIKGAVKLSIVIAKLLAAKKVAGARRIASFLSGGKGKLLTGALSIGATALTVGATSNAISNFGGVDPEPSQSGSEKPPTPKFNGGGLMNIGRMFSGLVKGPKGKDKVPAMLTDGEFVMSNGAVERYGVDTLESMNAAGGGTNIPEISMEGVTYASGGGYIGEDAGKERVRDPLLIKNSRIDATKISSSPVTSPSSSVDLNANVGDFDIDVRVSELMKSTSPGKIANYDKEYGRGAYERKLRQKLEKIYSSSNKSDASPPPVVKTTGPLKSDSSLPPDIKTTGPLLGRMAMNLPIGGIIRDVFGALKKKEINPQTILEEIKSRAKSMATSMGGTVKDGNIGTPTAQEQKDFDTLAASKAKLKSSSFMGTPKQDDSALRAEYLAIQDDPHHPLHTKVRGGYDVDDFGMSFSEFKRFKKGPQVQSAATTSPTKHLSSSNQKKSAPKITPIPMAKPETYAAKMSRRQKNKRGSGARGQTAPSPSPTHSSGTSLAQATLGVKR
tara:strand:- start:1932 stop:4214 length:2283 start_codon:yes stop_codon:yes gene_type:complete